jgi:hypothetical protein
MILDDYHYYAKDHPLTNNHYYYDAKDYHLYNELKIIIYNRAKAYHKAIVIIMRIWIIIIKKCEKLEKHRMLASVWRSQSCKVHVR